MLSRPEEIAPSRIMDCGGNAPALLNWMALALREDAKIGRCRVCCNECSGMSEIGLTELCIEGELLYAA